MTAHQCLDYPFTDFIWDGVKRALLNMAEIQFAAGAQSVYPAHEMAQGYTSWAQAKTAIAALPFKPLMTRVVSAHVMVVAPCRTPPGSAWSVPMATTNGVTNLSVHDSSLFPTSIGTNPQLSIYGITSRLASTLAEKLSGKPAPKLLAT